MNTIALAGAVALAFIIAGQVHAADPLARYDDHSKQGLTRVTGPTYVNSNYGYAIDIPAGQVRWMNTPPSPNHGVTIYLGDLRSIEIDASFDSALLGSTSAVADEVAGYISAARNFKKRTTLGAQPAVRVDQTFAGSERRRVVVAYWDGTSGRGDAVDFVFTLETTNVSYVADGRMFDAVVASFRRVPRVS